LLVVKRDFNRMPVKDAKWNRELSCSIVVGLLYDSGLSSQLDYAQLWVNRNWLEFNNENGYLLVKACFHATVTFDVRHFRHVETINGISICFHFDVRRFRHRRNH